MQPRSVRDRLRAPASFGIDLLMLIVILALAGALIKFGHQVAAPMTDKVELSLTLRALPKYTFFSLSRGFAAYVLSLIFTIVYGSIAAHNHRAEKVMIPALDVLQSIPVLSFLPVLVIAMIRLFPSRELGLEVACVVMIFTGQVWNMTFSYYATLRSMPSQLRDVTVVHHLSLWQRFYILELPASMIGLVWNSMMSMAGGWFFLSAAEAFSLGPRDYQLPGIGSYMQAAVHAHNVRAEIGAVVAMVLMIVVVDQFFWRPIVAWSERFKLEDTASADKAQSWVLSLLQHSWFYSVIRRALHERAKLRAESTPKPSELAVAPPCAAPETANAIINHDVIIHVVNWAAAVLIAVGAAWGGWQLIDLMSQLHLHDWLHVFLALLATFGRTSAAVLIATAWTLPVGILIGLSAKWSQRLQPIVQVLASFPAPMLYPLLYIALIWMHVPFTLGCIVLITMGAQWYILFNVIAGAMAIPSEMREVSWVYRTPRLKRWFLLYLPAVFPLLVTGLMTAAGGAWNATILAEILVDLDPDNPPTAFGIGSMITLSQKSNFPVLAASTVTMAATVVILNRLIWKRLSRLAERRYSLNV